MTRKILCALIVLCAMLIGTAALAEECSHMYTDTASAFDGRTCVLCGWYCDDAHHGLNDIVCRPMETEESQGKYHEECCAICSQSIGGEKAIHTFENGKCTVCGYKVTIFLNADTVTLKPGKTYMLHPKQIGTKGATFTFSSSNKNIATVDAKGKIRGIKKGTTTITVKAAFGGMFKVRAKVQ